MPFHEVENPDYRRSSRFSTEHCRLCGNRVALPCILEALPPKPLCDSVIQLFFQNVHPVLPILHISSFITQYQTFWTAFEDRDFHTKNCQVLREEPSFVALLFSMIFASIITNRLETGFDEVHDRSFLRDLDKATSTALALVGFPRNPSIYSLAAFIFSQNPQVREEELLGSATYVSISYRAALSMGLHKDGTDFGIGPIENEVRRRLWWHIIHMDVMTSTSTGLPPLFMDRSLANVAMILPLTDEVIASATDQDSRRTSDSVQDSEQFKTI